MVSHPRDENPLIAMARAKREEEEAKQGKSLVPQKPVEYVKFMVRLMNSKDEVASRPRSGVYRASTWGVGGDGRRAAAAAVAAASAASSASSADRASRRAPMGRSKRLASLVVRNVPKRPIARSEREVNWTLPAESPEAPWPDAPGTVRLIQEGQLDPSRWHFTRVEDGGHSR